MNFGRKRRSVFIKESLIIAVVTTLVYFYGDVYSNELSPEFLFFSLTGTIIGLYIIARRLNDINMSGWYSLFALIPFLNLIFFALYFIDGTVGDNKYGKDPKGRINLSKLPSKQKNELSQSSGIKEVERKLHLINESHKDGVLNKSEYENKKNELLINKITIEKKWADKYDYKLKLEKILELFENNIITKTELDFKIGELKKIYNYKETDFEFLDTDTNIYYLSNGEENGPITVKSIIDLIKKNKINPSSYIRLENEKSYDRRAYELMNHFE